MEKNFVRIQSNITIRVTAGLQNKDVTNADAHVPDRLKVLPDWQKMIVTIHQGAGIYPAIIASWNTVKALEKDGVLTIGEFLESADEDVAKEKRELERNMEETEGETKKRGRKKAASLDEIASDEE